VGNELKCRARFGKQSCEGKALLETNELIFRGDFRLKIPFAQMKSVKAMDGELRIEFAEAKKRAQPGMAVPLCVSFELGPQAEKWAHKILHPKTRIEKLGIKAGAKVSVIGELEKEFERELTKVTQAVKREKVASDAEWIFLCAETPKALQQSAKIAKALKGATALWIVYPKGREDITETDVIATGRDAGLKDVKVVGFSPTHTALKFVVPLERR
jgi:hypothetical protein